MKKTIYSLLSVTSLISTSAYAANTYSDLPKRTGFFAAPAFGLMFNNGTGYRDTPEATLSIGYSFTPYFALKGGGIFFIGRSKGNEANKFSTYTRIDAVFSLPNSTKFTPYILGGIGALSINNTEAAPNIGAGVAYTVSRNYAITFNYRSIFPYKTHGVMNTFDIGFIHYF
ncbi:outer membrane beta-barrel protein [Facilibium subflavum]|uniref:outer membrane beta-barrel protein n=1 Tax=Facilibium subflavum TaxID=2219058 RepID=UPI000E659E1C|nr:outer membrane beta-barrel protein [Facilibium subflavum]